MTKKLSNTQKSAMDAIHVHGEFIRLTGGFWTSNTAAVNSRGVPEWYFGTNTIYALIDKGYLKYSQYPKKVVIV